ncbi:MAG: DNA phosphorothioation system sulfurtransferase DndC, partial [Spirulinaceae cyanobacterium]
QIYKEVTGEDFDDPRPGAEDSLLGMDEWSTLEDICSDDTMHLELMSRLLDTERQYFTKSRRSGIFNDLEKCFEISSRSKEEAIANAHFKRGLKEAAQEGDVAAIKQLTLAENPVAPDTKSTQKAEKATENASGWGNLKFPSQNT